MQDKKSFDFVRFIKSQMLLVAGIVIFLIFGMIEHSFFTQSNIINIFRQIAVIAVAVIAVAAIAVVLIAKRKKK